MEMVQGASHEEGGVDTNQDVTLEGGELVFSKEDSATLSQAVASGDKDAVFNLVSKNLSNEVSEGEMGMGGRYYKPTKIDLSGYKPRKKR